MNMCQVEQQWQGRRGICRIKVNMMEPNAILILTRFKLIWLSLISEKQGAVAEKWPKTIDPSIHLSDCRDSGLSRNTLTSPVTSSSSSVRTTRSSQASSTKQPLECVLGLPRGLFPVIHAQNTSPPRGVQNRSLLMWTSRVSTSSFCWITKLLNLVPKTDPAP